MYRLQRDRERHLCFIQPSNGTYFTWTHGVLSCGYTSVLQPLTYCNIAWSFRLCPESGYPWSCRHAKWRHELIFKASVCRPYHGRPNIYWGSRNAADLYALIMHCVPSRTRFTTPAENRTVNRNNGRKAIQRAEVSFLVLSLYSLLREKNEV